MEVKTMSLKEALAEARVSDPGTREKIEYIDLDEEVSE